MAIDVNILTVEPTDNTLNVTVSVSTSSTDVIDYELNINDTDTGGTVTRSGTLDGLGGTYRGDEVIHEVQFGLNPPGEGTVTAQITSPEEYVGVQDQQSWEKAEGSLAINECNAQPTSSGDLEVTYTLTPSIGAEQTEREVTIRVDGQRVGSATHTIPGRTITRTQTIPADSLPTGSGMPVEIGVEGNFSECGTVTVGGAADGAINASGCSVSAADGTLSASVTLTGSTPTGDVLLTFRSDSAGSAPFTTVETGTEIDGQEVEVEAQPDWSGSNAVTIEASVVGADGSVLDTDTVSCGSVTLGGAPAGTPSPSACDQIVAANADALRQFGTPGEPFGQAALNDAQQAWERGEIDVSTLQSLLRAQQNGCVVPEGGGLPLRELAIGTAVIGGGYAASRFL